MTQISQVLLLACTIVLMQQGTAMAANLNRKRNVVLRGNNMERKQSGICVQQDNIVRNLQLQGVDKILMSAVATTAQKRR
jgi:hypothetical protein